MSQRRAVSKEMAKRYAKGSKGEKGRILDELCALTAWTRHHARRALGEVLERVARLGARLVLQTALEIEVSEFLGRNRYERRRLATQARAPATATAN